MFVSLISCVIFSCVSGVNIKNESVAALLSLLVSNKFKLHFVLSRAFLFFFYSCCGASHFLFYSNFELNDNVWRCHVYFLQWSSWFFFSLDSLLIYLWFCFPIWGLFFWFSRNWKIFVIESITAWLMHILSHIALFSYSLDFSLSSISFNPQSNAISDSFHAPFLVFLISIIVIYLYFSFSRRA